METNCSLVADNGANGALAWSSSDIEELNLPFTRFTLDNGLTVIVHEDRKVPVVAVNVTYLVGAKDEPAGRTGFAHLFEHLMFGGSQNFPGSYLVNLSDAGANDLNGTTSFDRTNYYETVPTTALDYALFAESDRMGHFAEAITQETLDQQREVVMNEKRQREGEPYGGVLERMLRALYPPSHPYAHTVLGSMQDLANAKLEDVRDWFRTWYGPNNAILTLAGDIDAATAREKAERYFGHIPSGRLPDRNTTHAWVPRLPEPWHETLYDQIPLSQLSLVWNLPPEGHPDTVWLQMAASLLTGPRTARLTKRLLHAQPRLASGVFSYVDAGQIASRFVITIDALDGSDDFRMVEAQVFEALEELRRDGPTEQELDRLKLAERAGFLRGLVSATSVAGLLSDNQRLLGRPDGYRQTLQQVANTTPKQVSEAVGRWLDDRALHLKVLPTPNFKSNASQLDRTSVPRLATPKPATLPALQRATLYNGLKVILAERHDRPLVEMKLYIPMGHADEPEGREGTLRLATSLLPQGAGERDCTAFAEASQDLAASVSAGNGLDWTVVSLSALSSKLKPSLQLFADVIQRPRFDESDFLREHQNLSSAIARELVTPEHMVMRLTPRLLFGLRHPYARPLSGTGTVDSLSRVIRQDVVDLHQRWFVPDGATLVIAGDITLDAAMSVLEKAFNGWQGKMPEREPIEETVLSGRSRGVHLLHRAGSSQSHIVAARLVVPFDARNQVAIDMANKVLGGGFSSRVNMNLREDKRWTYGVSAQLIDVQRGARPYLVQAPVQADRTAASMMEVLKDMQGMIGERPITAEELLPLQQAEAARLAGQGETLAGLTGSIDYQLAHDLPDDYWTTHADRVLALTVDEVNKAARDLIDPDSLQWVVVGDRSEVEPQLRDAGFTSVTLVEDVA